MKGWLNHLPLPVSLLSRSKWGWRICIPDKLPGDAGAAGPGTALGEPVPEALCLPALADRRHVHGPDYGVGNECGGIHTQFVQAQAGSGALHFHPVSTGEKTHKAPPTCKGCWGKSSSLAMSIKIINNL